MEKQGNRSASGRRVVPFVPIGRNRRFDPNVETDEETDG